MPALKSVLIMCCNQRLTPILPARRFGRFVEVIEDEAGLTAVLKFGGGCQGCSAVDVTLRQGVVQLKQQIPELTQVVDDTDHSISDHAYYKIIFWLLLVLAIV